MPPKLARSLNRRHGCVLSCPGDCSGVFGDDFCPHDSCCSCRVWVLPAELYEEKTPMHEPAPFPLLGRVRRVVWAVFVATILLALAIPVGTFWRDTTTALHVQAYVQPASPIVGEATHVVIVASNGADRADILGPSAQIAARWDMLTMTMGVREGRACRSPEPQRCALSAIASRHGRTVVGSSRGAGAWPPHVANTPRDHCAAIGFIRLRLRERAYRRFCCCCRVDSG